MTAIPEWMPADAWQGYLDMRKATKKVPTAHAVNLLISTLTKMRGEGQDVEAVLNQSTMNNWRGLFAVAERRNESRPGQRPAFAALGKHGQATANNLQDWLEEFQ